MSDQKKNYTSIIIIALLALLLAGAGFMYFQKDTELKNTKTELTSQIGDLKSNLENQIKLLDEKIAENAVLNEDLIAQREELDATLEELSASEASVGTLMKYKNRYFKLKSKVEELMVENDMLQMANTFLVKEKDSITGELSAQRILNDSLSTKAIESEKIILGASEVAVLGLKSISFKERSSGKQIPTTKARRTDKVKICFALAPNTIAEKGDKELYIQVIAPGNSVLGNNPEIIFDGQSLKYTIKSEFNYANKALDICEYITAPKDGFTKGTYFVNVFRADKRIANSSFELE